MGDPDQTHELLERANRGEPEALRALFEVVYAELRRLARRYMGRENPGPTLQTTALVHEAYLRLVRAEDQAWQSRAHFFLTGARAMRHILIDRARSRRSRPKAQVAAGEDAALDELAARYEDRSVNLLALHEALDRLAEIDAERAKVVELRFFGGLTTDEVAPLLNLSRATVERRWATARAWLQDRLGPEGLGDA